MFKDGQEVVVEGTLAQDGVFHANTLLTSCPSKYEAEREAGKSHPGDIPYPGTKKEASPKSTGFLPKTTI
jgi:cytochrome c-type biogenesis protein CcmE